MKFLVESDFQGQGPPKPQETTKTTGTIRTPRVGFGTGGTYIALFGVVFLFSDDFQPVLAMKFLVESEFQGQEPPKPPEPPVPPEPPEWVLVVPM